MENLEPYLDKFSESGRRVLIGALDESRRRSQNCVSVAHILHALTETEKELFDSKMRELSVDPNSVRSEIEKHLEDSRVHLGERIRVMPETTELFQDSLNRARSQNRRVIEAKDILYFLIAYKYSLLNNILRNLGKV